MTRQDFEQKLNSEHLSMPSYTIVVGELKREKGYFGCAPEDSHWIVYKTIDDGTPITVDQLNDEGQALDLLYQLIKFEMSKAN